MNSRAMVRFLVSERGTRWPSQQPPQRPGTQFWVAVVNCQLREATFVLDGLFQPGLQSASVDNVSLSTVQVHQIALCGFEAERSGKTRAWTRGYLPTPPSPTVIRW